MNNDKALNELLNKIREKEAQALLHIMQRLENYRQKCDWDSLCSLLLISGQNGLRIAFPLYYKLIPDNMKYDLVVSAYTHNGDHVHAVRKALRHARRYGSPVFPQELSQQDVFTVYRGGTETIEKAKCRISWTISQDTSLVLATTFILRISRFSSLQSKNQKRKCHCLH